MLSLQLFLLKFFGNIRKKCVSSIHNKKSLHTFQLHNKWNDKVVFNIPFRHLFTGNKSHDHDFAQFFCCNFFGQKIKWMEEKVNNVYLIHYYILINGLIQFMHSHFYTNTYKVNYFVILLTYTDTYFFLTYIVNVICDWLIPQKLTQSEQGLSCDLLSQDGTNLYMSVLTQHRWQR